MMERSATCTAPLGSSITDLHQLSEIIRGSRKERERESKKWHMQEGSGAQYCHSMRGG